MSKVKVDSSQFNDIKIAIASPSDIVKWSRGEANEVTKPETINYRTYKPEPEGLFCERIFGPMKDWECHCGKYKKIKHKGVICERCQVEITKSKVRRERMGFVKLNTPVSHIWYLKGVPSPMALLLDTMSPKIIEKILYYGNYVVIYKNNNRIEQMRDFIQKLIELEKTELRNYCEEDIQEDYEDMLQEIEDIKNNPDSKDTQQTIEVKISNKEKEHRDNAEAFRKECDNDCALYDTAMTLISSKKVKDDLTDEQNKAISHLSILLENVSDENFQEALDAVNKDGRYDFMKDKSHIRLDLLFEVGIGGSAIKELLAKLDLNRIKALGFTSQGSNQLKEARRLEVVDSFLFSKAKPEWMILECLPVISPELRPMVQLDGGRFATSDLNDLYRRVINRNNRLKRIMEYKDAPISILNHERRLLQEAIDAVLDNSKKQKPVTGSNNRQLKSLSDMLKGKEGRIRKNLLGKRVDYSGRSVIVVGPSLKIYQCGLPKEMALELFKPFVIKDLVAKGIASNIKAAKKLIEKVKPEVWDSLEEVICEYPVLLNRAPTLHRLGIQAFEPLLVDGKAIQLHPLVCSAFNADFDGDQMAVHVPLSAAAQAEARALMLASHNLFSPATGKPIVAPSQDVVLGCFYLTMLKDTVEVKYAEDDVYDEKGNIIAKKGGAYTAEVKTEFYNAKESDKQGKEKDVRKSRTVETGIKHKIRLFSCADDAIYAYYRGFLDLHEFIGVRLPIKDIVGEDGNVTSGTYLRVITAGRLIFNTILPDNMKYLGNEYYVSEKLKFDPLTKLILKDGDAVSKKLIGKLITECHERNGHDKAVTFLDEMKNLGYKYATIAGMSIAITDMDITSDRDKIIKKTQKQVEKIEQLYNDGSYTQTERREAVLKKWTDASAQIADSLMEGIEQFNQIAIITKSGARGSTKQISQLSGMRGLMSDPQGNPIEDLPVISNFHEGLSVLEYFVSTHGARKGLADTALRTADAGYLTRRLVDVAQDVIVREHNCGTHKGIEVTPIYEKDNPGPEDEPIETVADRIAGRTALKTIGNPEDILTEDIYKFYDPYLFEYESKEIVTDQKPDDYTNVTTINTGLAKPVIYNKKHSEWKINREGEFKWVAKSEIAGLFPIVKNRDIKDENGNTVSVSDTVCYDDETGRIFVKDYTENVIYIDGALEKFDSAGEIDPRNAWVVRDEIISDAMAAKISKAWDAADALEKETGIPKKFRVWIRSPFTCESKMGICSKCYGKDLSLKIPVEVGTAVGIIAAQSIGEPGTQLTMRTFHTGGVAGKYLTGVANVKKKQQEALKGINADKKKGLLKEDSKDKNSTKSIQSLMAVLEDPQGGLLRVGELFEARKPKGKAITSDMDGIVTKVDQEGSREVWIESEIKIRDIDIDCLLNFKFQGDLFYKNEDGTEEKLAAQGNQMTEDKVKELETKKISVIYLRKKYLVPHRGELSVPAVGQPIKRGQKITPGPLDPSQVLQIADNKNNANGVGGELDVMKYIVEEIQKVYKSQGVDINDKHVEVIVRQMLRKVLIVAAKDTDLKAGQILDRAVVKTKNDELAEGQKKAIYTPILYGITDASLNTDSFLSAASFQKTTRVLTDAAVKAKKDNLIGLKENVIIGRLIPAGTGLKRFRKVVLLDKNGKPLPTTRYIYEPQNDKTLLSEFEWKKGAKKCIEELGVETVGEIYPKLHSLSDWGVSVEREIQEVIYRHIEDQNKNTKNRNDVLVDTNGKAPDEAQLENLGVEFEENSAEDVYSVDENMNAEDVEDLSDVESYKPLEADEEEEVYEDENGNDSYDGEDE
ncbi:MAG: DNA-directed RNA polymerase subunit beta' [Armatimonadetes bacterium]|nr:DNA-directed RNA polymerase subunit beta' [Candidatus Hippobium faecium]